jgi:HK97 gp10 family phage protein
MAEELKDQIERLRESFRAKGNKVDSNMGRVITKACLLVEREAKISMTKTELTEGAFSYESAVDGKIRTRGAGVSIPGNPPAVQTGRLRASITHRLEGGGFDKKTKGFVGTNVVYGRHLEFGTSEIAARPWLTPAFEKYRDTIRKMIAEATSNALKGKDETEDTEGGSD